MATRAEDLYELLVALTGEDSAGLRRELDRLVAKLGLRPNQLNENHVRQLVALYLEEIHSDNDPLNDDSADDTIPSA